jgi:hypothetical protein
MELAGRHDDIEAFEVLVDRVEAGRAARSIVFTGLRGVGKTVLLQDLAGRAEQRGWITARVEADRGSGPTSFTDGLSRSLATSLRREQGRGTTKERLLAALRTVTSFSMSFNPDGAVSLGFDVEAARGRADSGSLYADLTDLALDLGAAALDLGVGVAVFVDEMQDLTPEELSAVCRACHETGQRSSPWFVIGGGLPNLPGALATAESYAERLFEYRVIDRLPEVAAHAALVNPAKVEGVDWEPLASALVVAESAGYPYFIQQFGQSTWNDAAGSPITLADAERGVKVGFQLLDKGFFRARWDRATPSERAYLAAMAADGDGPSSSSEVARRVGKLPTSLGPARANLINKGIIYAPEHGQIAFTVPGMATFIERHLAAG